MYFFKEDVEFINLYEQTETNLIFCLGLNVVSQIILAKL